MESTAPAWRPARVLLLLLLVVTHDARVLGRALRAGSPGTAEAKRRCAGLAAPWTESLGPAPGANASLSLQLRVRPLAPWPTLGLLLFPGKPLLSFVRRVYRCCQERPGCSSVKGVPGRLRGGTAMEFLLTREILSLTTATRAELHLQLSNPRGLEIRPVLTAAAKRGLPTRYSKRSSGSTVELQVDLLNLLQSLQQEAASGAGEAPDAASLREVASSSRMNQRPLQDSGTQWRPGSGLGRDLGLLLGCTGDESAESCQGVHLLHTPFMAVYYS